MSIFRAEAPYRNFCPYNFLKMFSPYLFLKGNNNNINRVSKPMMDLFKVAKKLSEKEASKSKTTPQSRRNISFEFLHGASGSAEAATEEKAQCYSSLCSSTDPPTHQFCLHTGTSCLITSLYKTLSDAQVRIFRFVFVTTTMKIRMIREPDHKDRCAFFSFFCIVLRKFHK